jgi:hypothetical protein
MGIRRGSISTPIIADGLVLNIDAANRASTIPSTSTLKTFNTIDTSISGTFEGGANYDSSTVTPSFNFDGFDEYIDMSSTVIDFTTGDFTTAAWINVANDGNHQGIFGIRISGQAAASLQFYVRNNNLLYSWNGSTDVTSTSTISNDVWVNAVLVQNGSNKEFYINGSLDRAVAQGNGNSSSATLKLGYTGHGAEFLYGNIGPAQIYNRALSSTEILHNYNALKGRFGL